MFFCFLQRESGEKRRREDEEGHSKRKREEEEEAQRKQEEQDRGEDNCENEHSNDNVRLEISRSEEREFINLFPLTNT